MKLLLDEMIGPAVARELRTRNLDTIAVTERTDLRALPDEEILAFAQEENRILVTRNIGDFARLHQQWLAGGQRHRGVVMVTERSFPQNRNLVGALVGALDAAAKASALPGPGEVLYLPTS